MQNLNLKKQLEINAAVEKYFRTFISSKGLTIRPNRKISHVGLQKKLHLTMEFLESCNLTIKWSSDEERDLINQHFNGQVRKYTYQILNEYY